MKIITEGKLPQERIHTGTCRNCGCKFEFTEKEATFRSFPSNESFLEIICPTFGCGTKVFVDYQP